MIGSRPWEAEIDIRDLAYFLLDIMGDVERPPATSHVLSESKDHPCVICCTMLIDLGDRGIVGFTASVALDSTSTAVS